MAYNILKSSIVSLILTLLIATPVFAGVDVTTGTSNLSLTIGQGNFTLTVDPTAGLQAVTVSTVSQTTYTGLSVGNDTGDILVQVDDARGANTPAGWSITATVSKLVQTLTAEQITNGETAATIPVTNFTNNFSTVTAAVGSPTANITPGTGAAVVDGNTDGVSDPFSVLVASAGTGQGNYQLDMGFSLVVDPNQPAGNYTGNVIVTRI